MDGAFRQQGMLYCSQNVLGRYGKALGGVPLRWFLFHGKLPAVPSDDLCHGLRQPPQGHELLLEMPFKCEARTTVENLNDNDINVYYQTDYTKSR